MSSTDDLIREFLAAGGAITRCPEEPPAYVRPVVRRGKFKAAKSFKPGGKLS